MSKKVGIVLHLDDETYGWLKKLSKVSGVRKDHVVAVLLGIHILREKNSTLADSSTGPAKAG